MLSLFRRKPIEVPLIPFDFDNNPYKAKRTWPPDFDKLSPKQKFKLERKFRRRSKLAYARPEWNRRLLLAQWGACVFVAGYSILYLDWEGEGKPYEALRKAQGWWHGLGDSIWTHSASDINRKHLARVQEDKENVSAS
jgi:hypothetical protein